MIKMEIPELDFKTRKKVGILAVAYYCSKCGIKVTEDASVCRACGHVLEDIL